MKSFFERFLTLMTVKSLQGQHKNLASFLVLWFAIITITPEFKDFRSHLCLSVCFFFVVVFLKIALKTAFSSGLIREQIKDSFLFNDLKWLFTDVKIVVLKILRYSQENICVWVFFLIKLRAGKPATLLKKRLQHRCLLVKIAKFLRVVFLKNNFGGCFGVFYSCP